MMADLAYKFTLARRLLRCDKGVLRVVSGLTHALLEVHDRASDLGLTYVGTILLHLMARGMIVVTSSNFIRCCHAAYLPTLHARSCVGISVLLVLGKLEFAFTDWLLL